MVTVKMDCVCVAVWNGMRLFKEDEGVIVAREKSESHHQKVQKLGQVEPVVREMGLKLEVRKPGKDWKALIEGKHKEAFEIIAGRRCGVWLVRLVQARDEVENHCVLVNALTGMIPEAAEKVPIKVCAESLRICGGKECPTLYVAEMLEMVDA